MASPTCLVWSSSGARKYYGNLLPNGNLVDFSLEILNFWSPIGLPVCQSDRPSKLCLHEGRAWARAMVARIVKDIKEIGKHGIQDDDTLDERPQGSLTTGHAAMPCNFFL